MKQRTQFNYAQRWKIAHSRNERVAKKKLRSIVMGSFIVFLLIGLAAFPWLWQFALQYKLEKVEAQIVYYQEVEKTLTDIDRLEGELSRMNNFLEMTEGKTKNPRKIMGDIRGFLPAGSTITSFSLQSDNSVQLGVILPGPADLAKLWINFRDSGLFAEFDLDTVSLTDEVKRLNLTLKLK